MKLRRYGTAGQKRPGLLDDGGRIRDLSDHVPDIDQDCLRLPVSLRWRGWTRRA